MGSANHQGEKGDGVTEEVDKNKTKDKLKKFGKKVEKPELKKNNKIGLKIRDSLFFWFTS